MSARMLVVMAAPVFWLVISALSMLNFGADLIVAGTGHLSGWDVMVMTGSWLMAGGVAVLVWTATTRRRLPRREVGHDADRYPVFAGDRAAVRRIRHAHHRFRRRVGQLHFGHVVSPADPVDSDPQRDHIGALGVSQEPDRTVRVPVPRHARGLSRADLHDCLL